METKHLPIDVRPLFRPLEDQFIALLEQMTEADWDRQTIATQWKVKDVVSHLLDGNLRVLSMQRDKYFGENPPNIRGYRELVDWLNQLNANWVEATKRLSLSVLILLHRTTGPLVCDYYENLDLDKEAIFSVDWAGENKSLNRMHLAREYSEKWHHQQQIRLAVGKEGIMTKRFFYPLIDTFLRALPHTFRDMNAPTGTVVEVKISTEAGGSWFLKKEKESWSLTPGTDSIPGTIVEIPAEISWQLFSKSLRPVNVRDQIFINGDTRLGEKVLDMISVMA